MANKLCKCRYFDGVNSKKEMYCSSCGTHNEIIKKTQKYSCF